ncbi:MAG: Ste24 endopeptidase [Ignavibacteria bacterium]|nr:Ste24 endopeptidase [Ignavibacteria bacterium]
MINFEFFWRKTLNIYALIILITIIIGFVLDTISDILNLSYLGKPLPKEFEGVFDSEKYLKSQSYTRTQTYFGFITSTFDLVILLIFWFAGGFEWVNQLIIPLSDSIIIRGLIFAAVLMLGNFVLGLPFGIYSTFVIEEKFGFNKTTVKTFILDIIKSMALSVVLGGLVLSLILYILMQTGSEAWLYGWIAVTIITLVIQFIAPTWIMPLFNKFKPLDDGELKSAILDYAASVKFALKNIFVMDGSKRSSKSNAFFTGFGKNKRIALFDTLIEKHTTSELVAVLAHEIGHYKKKHIITGMVISILHFGLLFYLLSIFLNEKGLYDAFFMTSQPIYAGLVFFGMLYSPIEMLLGIAMNILSRKNEFEADKFSGDTTGKPEELCSALLKMSEHNLSNLNPHPFYVFVNYSHPPVLIRIQVLRRLLGSSIN